MDNLMEFIIGLSASYFNGSKDYFTIRYRDKDGESARYSVWHEFKSLQHNHDIECLTTTLH